MGVEVVNKYTFFVKKFAQNKKALYISPIINKLKHKTMTTTNKKITIEEARELIKSVGMTYPGTEHNKKMIAQAVREIIVK